MGKKENNEEPVSKQHEIEMLEVWGARSHNLKNIDVSFPREQLVVVTGVSGSGKSSLVFDTICAEGQRRYMESFSGYARNFMGKFERPDVDRIEGLSPIISIQQKTTNRNPRSTVGTITEIYDYLRLLFARAGEAYSYLSGEKMSRQSHDQILQQIESKFANQTVTLLAPLIKGRKGHYKELFQRISKLGFNKFRIDGVIEKITKGKQLDRYKTHDIELVVDNLWIDESEKQRTNESLHVALKHGKGMVVIVDEAQKSHYFSTSFMDPSTGLSYSEPAPNSFSFNTPYGACPTCNGLGEVKEINELALVPDKSLSIEEGGIAPLGPFRNVWVFKRIRAILQSHGYSLADPIKDLPDDLFQEILYGSNREKSNDKEYATDFDEVFHGVVGRLTKLKEKKNPDKNDDEDFLQYKVCPECNGERLKKESLFFKIDQKNISELAQMNVQDLKNWFDKAEKRLTARQRTIGEEIIKEIKKRIQFLLEIGLDYLSLDRPVQSLSGGEMQRVRLATQIGTQLVGVLYILDEPSIGLHQRDSDRLIETLKKLRELGNSVVVVEHDKSMMLASDYIIDIGPGAGANGGEIVAAGSPKEFIKSDTYTADYLTNKKSIPITLPRRKGNGKEIIIRGCTGNNLLDVTLKIPLGKLICVTGVSGSGKSTLIQRTLFPLLSQKFYRSTLSPMSYKAVEGLEHLNKVVDVNQAPIGRTPRSNPATYTGLFSEIRKLFAMLPEAKMRGYSIGRFSFNVKGGRCEDCTGAGIQVIEMDFLPSIRVECETCKGDRYNRETLEVRYKGRSIANVLNLSISEAASLFENYPKIVQKLRVLEDVGLGYLTLGQHATTLSGGEAQRVKLATELAKKDTGKTLYILDEPTTGLHFQDIELLLGVIQKLMDKGNTVLIIEHNLDVIKAADHIIDLGPEGGKRGGEIIIEGTPEEVAQHPTSYTAKFLKEELDFFKNN